MNHNNTTPQTGTGQNNRNNGLRGKKYFDYAVAVFSSLLLLLALWQGWVIVQNYIRFNSVKVKFNNDYILCQRYEPYRTDEYNGRGTAFTHMDTITLNFVLINNNPLRNLSVGDLYIYVTTDDEQIKNFIKKGDFGKYENYFVYKAQYVFNEFNW